MSEHEYEVEPADEFEQQDELELVEELEGVEGALRFESLDTGEEVLAYAHGTGEGQVAFALSHEMDGELEIFISPKVAEQLALALARASDEAKGMSES